MAELIPFDDRDGSIWLDGKLISWRDAKIHVLSHGLHYASCVFEGERVYDGQVFKLADHSQRLADSAAILGMELDFGAAEIDAATREVVRANSCGDAYVRPIIWRGSEMMGVAAQAAKPRFAIATWAWPSYFSLEARNRGIRLAMAKWSRPAPNTAPTKAKATGPLHDLHHEQARGRARRLRRRPDARLSRPDRRVDRRQHLSGDRRRDPLPDAGLLPRRHHAPHRDRARPRARLQGDRAGPSRSPISTVLRRSS